MTHAPTARRRLREWLAGMILSLSAVFFLPIPARAQTNIPFGSGPIMQTSTVYLIFWLPAGHSYDTTVADGIGNYETVLTQFFNNVASTTYYAITGQYSGTCGSNLCLVQNSQGAVRVGATYVDTRPYAHVNGTAAAGTEADPLLDADIQHEVQSIITQYGLSDGTNVEFFVFTAAGIQECISNPQSGSRCTFVNPNNPSGVVFCAYHGGFTDSNGNTAIYAFMANVNAIDGCAGAVTVSPNGQVSTDREIVVTSHEFFESVTDPLGSAWKAADGSEVGDNCAQQVGTLRADGSNVTLNGAEYVVQQIWSNSTSSCSLGVPSIQLTISTGDDNLRDDSSATASIVSAGGSAIQTFTLKTQFQPAWDNNTTNQQVFGFASSTAPQFGSVMITLTSHNSGVETDDNWNIQGLSGQEFDPAGNQICQFSGNGNPLFRLTGDVPSQSISTIPACAPSPKDCTTLGCPGGQVCCTCTITVCTTSAKCKKMCQNLRTQGAGRHTRASRAKR
jgi:hypothetical protein